MKTRLETTARLRLGVAGVGALMLASIGSAQAGVITATLEDFTNGYDFSALVTIEDTEADKVAITVDISGDINADNGGVISEGDILGVFLDVADAFDLSTIMVVAGSAFGSDETPTVTSTTDTNLGNNGNGNNGSTLRFDLAYDVGVQGGGEGKNQTIGFSLMAAGLSTEWFLDQTVGARVQSITNGDLSGASSKLSGTASGGPPTEVSSPGTLALAGAGLLGLGAWRRRRDVAKSPTA